MLESEEARMFILTAWTEKLSGELARKGEPVFEAVAKQVLTELRKG